MAASAFSPGGFSYAQAAKGRSSLPQSQTPSSKVTSGAATPATGTFSDLTPGSNWADDMESSVKDKKSDEQAMQLETEKSLDPKDASVERAKAEDNQQHVSAVSSPDMTASSSTATKEDDASSAPNATSSESTWETKSQTSTSEPAWIAERTARQSNGHQSDKESKKKEKSKEAPAVQEAAPLVLQEAPIPENFWTKRAAARTQDAPKPVIPSTPANNAKKENHIPSATLTMSNSTSQSSPLEGRGATNDSQSRSAVIAGKRPVENRHGVPRQNPRWTTQNRRSDSPLSADPKPASSEPNGPHVASPAPPSVNDTISWPTPDLAEKDRKDSTENSGAEKVDEKRDEDSTPAPKRKKSEWTPMAITPTFIYDTTGTNKPHEKKSHASAHAESGSRGGTGARGGRGGLRGRPNGPERNTRSEVSQVNGQTETIGTPHEKAESRDRAAMPPPPRPARGSSVDATSPKYEEPTEDNISAESTLESKDPIRSLPNGPAAMNGSFSKPFAEERRNKIQRRSELENKEDVVPKPIPRRSSPGTMADAVIENGPKGPHRAPPIRKVTSDRAQDHRGSGDSTRDGGLVPAPRGGKRNGRGRGGARDMANGHGPAASFQGSTQNDFPPSPFTPPTYPGAYHGYRGQHQYSFPPSRPPFRGNSRSQSIPVENFFNPRYSNAYGSPQQAPPQLQTYWQPGMGDMQSYPMSAAPMLQGDTASTILCVKQQVEYYFSIENLAKDVHLRKHMDSQGFVPLQVIADFPRVKRFTQGDTDFVKAACMTSEDVDVRVGEDGQERLRKRRDWENFVMPMDERHAPAQNAGPERLETPERPQILTNNLPPQLHGPQSAGLPASHHRYDRRSYDSAGFQPMDPYLQNFYGYGGFPQEVYGAHANGDESRGRTVRSPMHENVASPSQQSATAALFGGEELGDPFSDEQMSVLTVVVTMAERRQPYHTLASRTFSNGSIDSRHTLSEPEQRSSSKNKPITSEETHLNGTGDANGTQTASSERKEGGSDVGTVYWVKDQDTSVDNLPQGLVPYPYLQLRDEALQQRSEAVTGNCPKKLDILYQFWSHFLIRNFNGTMYAEFKRLAWEDGSDRYTFTGLENLAKFFHESLINKKAVVREQVAKDYVELVNNMPKGLKEAPFRSLRSAWRDGSLNLKSRKRLSDMLDPLLKAKLDEHSTPTVEASAPVAPL